MHQHPEYSIVVLCYGSGDLVYGFVNETIKCLLANKIQNYQLVLVGNYFENSDDPTPEILKTLAKNNPRITAVTKPKRGMMGWDMRAGLTAAAGKYISVIDGDGQMPVEDLVTVYKQLVNSDYDLVKTFRTTREDGASRKIISSAFNVIFRLLFPSVKSKDINSKPKIFSRANYEKLNLRSDDWFIDAEIMIQAGRLGFTIGEVPTHFRAATRGDGSFINAFTFLEFMNNLMKFRIKEFWKKKR